MEQRTKRTSVEAAIDQRHREVEAQAEADRWGEAAGDRAFRDEAAQIAREFDAAETLPD